MGTLNKKKPFGEVCGVAPYRFEQFGRFFDQMGREVNGNGVLIEDPVPAPKKPEEIKVDPIPEPTTSGPVLPPPLGTEESSPPPGPVLQPPAVSEDTSVDGYGTRDEIVVRLDELKIPYNPKSRRSKLIELLPKEG